MILPANFFSLTEFIREEQLRIAEGHLQKVAEIGRAHGIDFEQMANILKLFYEE